MLTRDELIALLALLAERTIVEPTKDFPYRITRRETGYSGDPKLSALQAKLSIMLEVASHDD